MGRWLAIVGLAIVPLTTSHTAAHGLGGGGSLQTVIEFNPALGELPESIAADAGGNLYVSMGSSVVRVDAERVASTLASLPVAAGVFATGVKLGPDGSLYVGSAGFDPTLEGSFVWRVSPSSGAVQPVAELDPEGFPNDLAFDDDGTIYVTDSFLGSIWRITPDGEATEWLSDPALDGNPDEPALVLTAFGADGIAFDRLKRHLYVSNLDFGTILRVRVRRDGTPGPVELFAADERLVGADGIAFDQAGVLYVAVNAQDRIATVDRRGRVRVVHEGAGLDGPSSLAFGVRPWERRTLFISNFAISRAQGTQSGEPNPGIVALDARRPGLPIP